MRRGISIYNGRDYEASIVGTDPSTDLAVLKLTDEIYQKLKLHILMP